MANLVQQYNGGENEADSSVKGCGGFNQTKHPLRIRVCVFFDGTLNNRTNVKLGLQRIDHGASYRTGITNVAIMEEFFRGNDEADISFSLYVEGIGTTDEKADNKRAAAIAKGSTGILDKVEAGIDRVKKHLMARVPSKRPIEYVHLDAIGFSRGAAAARNFIYASLLKRGEALKDRLELEGYEVGSVNVKFVGLYDTVASYGFSHTKNTEQLHLDAVSHAEYVIQLAAAEEHRKYYALTDIQSAPHGVEIFLPGAHSDIGGGYTDNMNEIDLQILDLDRLFGLSDADIAAVKRERQWLLDSGWYTEGEIHDINFWNELRVTRSGISNSYSKIPLKVMTLHAEKRGVFFKSDMLLQNPVPDSLNEIEAQILSSYAFSAEHWLSLKTPAIRRLRHDYLHFSAYYGSIAGSNQPQFSNDDPVHGRRERTIRHG